MLARRLPGLLPMLTEDQALEVTAVHSIAGLLSPDAPLVAVPPFVAPHHSTSVPGLVGGGIGPGQAGRDQPGAPRGPLHGRGMRVRARTAWKHSAPRWRKARSAWRGETASPATRRTSSWCSRPTRAPARRRASWTAPARHTSGGATWPPVRPAARPRGPAGAHAPDHRDVGSRGRCPGVDRHRPRPGRQGPGQSGRPLARVRLAHQRPSPGPILRREFALPRKVTALLDRVLDTGAVTARGADRCLRVAWTLSDLAEADRPEADHVAAALEFRDRRAA